VLIKRTYGDDAEYWIDVDATGETFQANVDFALGMGDYALLHRLEYGRWPPPDRTPWLTAANYTRFQKKLSPPSVRGPQPAPHRPLK
jgi:hypothetical protein